MKKQSKSVTALVAEMTVKRNEERKSLRVLAPLLKAQYATLWRWERKVSEPNSFHVHQLKKWLGYL